MVEVIEIDGFKITLKKRFYQLRKKQVDMNIPEERNQYISSRLKLRKYQLKNRERINTYYRDRYNNNTDKVLIEQKKNKLVKMKNRRDIYKEQNKNIDGILKEIKNSVNNSVNDIMLIRKLRLELKNK